MCYKYISIQGNRRLEKMKRKARGQANGRVNGKSKAISQVDSEPMRFCGWIITSQNRIQARANPVEVAL
jgi:hypothetical protein